MALDGIPDAIQWHEGMLLSPQHFQQSAWRHEALVQYGMLSVAPFGWGIRTLKIDQGLLPAGTFRVLELEATMPDGAVVFHYADEEDDLEFDLTAHSEEIRRGDLTLYLASPVRGQRGQLTRYRAYEGGPISDEFTGEGELRIPRVRPQLLLLAGDTPPGKYESFPLAKVTIRDEAFALTEYLPPRTRVERSSPLAEMCSLVVKRLREKAVFLSEQVRSPSAGPASAFTLDNKNRIQSLVAGLPVCEAALAVGVTHPYTLYLTFCGLAGHLAALGESLAPPAFAAYDHNDPRASFAEVTEYALRMIAEGISDTFTGVPFWLQDGVFHTRFDGAWASRKLVLALRVPAGASESDLRAWAETSLIGSESIVPTLRDKRILGAPRRFTEREDDLAPMRGVLLFLLTPSPEFVRPGEQLQILNPDDRGGAHPSAITLYIKIV
jgi:type VI secretion system protein ImpJ